MLGGGISHQPDSQWLIEVPPKRGYPGPNWEMGSLSENGVMVIIIFKVLFWKLKKKDLIWRQMKHRLPHTIITDVEVIQF